MPKNKIKTFASDAKNSIAWLATTHIVVNSFRGDISRFANELLKNADDYLRDPTEGIKRKIVGYLEKFYPLVKDNKIPENFGHRQNKAAIFGVDAILQAYLDDMYRAVASAELRSRSIRRKVEEIENAISGISLQNLPTVNHAFFIAEMRHSITHRNGEVDGDFLRNCGIDEATRRLIQGKSPLWDTNLWPTENEFLAKFQPPNMNGNCFQLNLNIEKVVLPYLYHAIEFVDEVLTEFEKIYTTYC